MRLFKSNSRKTVVKTRQQPISRDDESIGSELSLRDQFEILVKTPRADRTVNPSKKRSNRIFLGYFSDDTEEDSTVSSITAADRGYYRFGPSSGNYEPYSVNSGDTGWCCCSADTTIPDSTNKSMTNQSIRAETETERDTKRSAATCCTTECEEGNDQSKRRTKTRSRRLWGRKFKRNSSASLFDTLSDEDFDETEAPTADFTDGSTRPSTSRSKRSIPKRKVLTRKRKA